MRRSDCRICREKLPPRRAFISFKHALNKTGPKAETELISQEGGDTLLPLVRARGAGFVRGSRARRSLAPSPRVPGRHSESGKVSAVNCGELSRADPRNNLSGDASGSRDLVRGRPRAPL